MRHATRRCWWRWLPLARVNACLARLSSHRVLCLQWRRWRRMQPTLQPPSRLAWTSCSTCWVSEKGPPPAVPLPPHHCRPLPACCLLSAASHLPALPCHLPPVLPAALSIGFPTLAITLSGTLLAAPHLPALPCPAGSADGNSIDLVPHSIDKVPTLLAATCVDAGLLQGPLYRRRRASTPCLPPTCSAAAGSTVSPLQRLSSNSIDSVPTLALHSIVRQLDQGNLSIIDSPTLHTRSAGDS